MSATWYSQVACRKHTPNLPTKIIPTKTAWLKLSGRFPMGLGIPPLNIKILLESNPLKSRILVRRLAVFPLPKKSQASEPHAPTTTKTHPWRFHGLRSLSTTCISDIHLKQRTLLELGIGKTIDAQLAVEVQVVETMAKPVREGPFRAGGPPFCSFVLFSPLYQHIIINH